MASNIVKEYIDFSKKNITKYLKIILEQDYSKEIIEPLLDTYINVRYYNNYDIKYKVFESNINYYMKQKAIKINEEKEEEYISKVKKIFYLFKYILYFDNVLEYESLKKIISEIDEYRNEVLGLTSENFIEELNDIVKENEKRKETFIEELSSDHFNLEIKNTNNKNVFKVKLNNNIKFNKIYSDYSINKVYNEGLVDEQKHFILYYLITREILKNIIKGDFTKEYIISFPNNIFTKQQKINRLIAIIDDESIKNNIVIEFTYTDYLSNKEIINSWIKKGFQIAIKIDEKYKYDNNSKIWLDIFKYVIVDKEKKNFFDEDQLIIE